MEKTVGAKAILWSSIGAELTTVVYDLRYMVMLALICGGGLGIARLSIRKQ